MIAIDLTAPMAPTAGDNLTDEQLAIISIPPTQNIIVEAGPGVGKTSTLVKYAQAHRAIRGLYLAFNRPIAEEAKSRFPDNIKAMTAHSYAFRALNVGKFASRLKNRIQRQDIRLAGIDLVNGILSPDKMMRAIQDGIHNFCNDEGTNFYPHHCNLHRMPPAAQERVVPMVARAVKKFLDYETSGLPFTHDIYLKNLEMKGKIGDVCEYIMVDEAQDTNPVLMSLLKSSGKPIIVVGDKHQSIYAFRGATNALAQFEGKRLPLSMSWRFGPEIAEIANLALTYSSQSNDHPVRGRPDRESKIELYSGHAPQSAFLLARTNSRLFEGLVNITDTPFHVAGGFDEMASQLLSALALAQNEQAKVTDPYVRSFALWDDLLEEASEQDPDAKRLAKIVSNYGNEIPVIVERLRSLHRPHPLDAKLLLSTAHKAKGLEADTVIILDDFETPEEILAKFVANDISRGDFDQEINLIFVALSRARHLLLLSQPMYNWWLQKRAEAGTRPTV